MTDTNKSPYTFIRIDFNKQNSASAKEFNKYLDTLHTLQKLHSAFRRIHTNYGTFETSVVWGNIENLLIGEKKEIQDKLTKLVMSEFKHQWLM